jgi:type III secretory pathway component EscR
MRSLNSTHLIIFNLMRSRITDYEALPCVIISILLLLSLSLLSVHSLIHISLPSSLKVLIMMHHWNKGFHDLLNKRKVAPMLN